MPADPHLHLRDAGTWDTAYIVEVLTLAAASTPLATWLHPNADARARHLHHRIRAVVTDRIAQANVRVAVEDDRILGASVWTTCTDTAQASPSPDDLLLRHEGDAHRARLLQQQLTGHHPTQPHQHLLLLGVPPRNQRHGIGTALFTDWHHLSTHTPTGRYLLAPNTLANVAVGLGYHPLGQPITTSLTAPLLSAMWHPQPRPHHPRQPGRPVHSQAHSAGATPW
jgi:hypothetical protein